MPSGVAVRSSSFPSYMKRTARNGIELCVHQVFMTFRKGERDSIAKASTLLPFLPSARTWTVTFSSAEVASPSGSLAEEGEELRAGDERTLPTREARVALSGVSSRPLLEARAACRSAPRLPASPAPPVARGLRGRTSMTSGAEAGLGLSPGLTSSPLTRKRMASFSTPCFSHHAAMILWNCVPRFTRMLVVDCLPRGPS
mmetsp:Transcript_34611/g.107685  ORF Transcript_34611/g.107685 Transcript_34611/m.107685 type:complete len:200 (+) Transcript_34611:946-1545(+)